MNLNLLVWLKKNLLLPRVVLQIGCWNFVMLKFITCVDNLIKENGALMKWSDLEFSVIYHMPVLAILASFKYKLRYTKEQLVHEPWSLDTYSKIGVTLVLLILNIVTNGLVCVIDSHSFWLFIISSYSGSQMNLIVAFFG